SFTFVFLLIALFAILRGNVKWHKRFIYGAFVTTFLFLISYVTFHFLSSSTSYGGDGFLKLLYYFVLITYILFVAVFLLFFFICVFFVTTFLFLISYVTFHFLSSSTSYGGDGFLKYLYYFVLITHIILAAVIVPFVLTTVARAWNREYDRHKKIARITMPLWL